MASIKTAIAVTVAVLLCSPSLAADLNLGGEVPLGSIHVGEFTPGGCAQVCEDAGFCTDWRISTDTASCWLIIDREDPRFIELAKSCPQQAFRAEIMEADTQLLCKKGD